MNLRSAASSALQKAVAEGQLPRVNTLLCSDCGAQASDYHHHNGYERTHWLDVVPLCRKCHRHRHGSTRSKVITKSGETIRLVCTHDDKALLVAIARQDGDTSQSATVRRLIAQEAQRRGIVVDNEPVQAA